MNFIISWIAIKIFDIIAISETRITKQVSLSNNLNLKACVCYFLSNLYFSPKNNSPSKTMNNVFYFIKRALFVLEIFKMKNLKIYDVINCLHKNLITYFVWHLEKEIRCDIETLPIDRELNMKNHAENMYQKLAPDPFLIYFFQTQSLLMEKIIKNKRGLELVPSHSSGHETSSEKILYLLYIIWPSLMI